MPPPKSMPKRKRQRRDSKGIQMAAIRPIGLMEAFITGELDNHYSGRKLTPTPI
jgi:hypothetical protein